MLKVLAHHVSYFVILTIFLSACSLPYITKQGYFQLKMLSSSIPIKDALRKPTLSSNDRNKLKHIVNVREFAKNQIFLDTHHNYTNVCLTFNPVLYSVTACPQLSFEPYTWWFPIIGEVPYKGFFEEKDADKEKNRLEALGLEVSKGQIAGYSTLGFFSDPVWPSMLQESDIELTDLIIHELVHATVYINGSADFNESLASFIAKEGTKKYYQAKLSEVERFYLQKEKYHNFFYKLYLELEKLYEKKLNDDEKRQKKHEIFASYEQNAKKEFPQKSFAWSKINNPFLLSFKRYNSDDEVLNELFLMVNKDFYQFLVEIKRIKRTKNPQLALKARIKEISEERNLGEKNKNIHL